MSGGVGTGGTVNIHGRGGLEKLRDGVVGYNAGFQAREGDTAVLSVCIMLSE